jgi:putative salt-induced outer membrane protein
VQLLPKRLINPFLLALIVSVSAPVQADEGYKNESELGTTIISGSTNTATYNAKQTSIYEWHLNTVKGALRYLNTQSSGADTAKNWDGTLRYERQLSDIFNAFLAHTWDSDIFAGYVQKNSVDLGIKYFFIKKEEEKVFAEAGYRNSSTHYPSHTQADGTVNAARAYIEGSKNISQAASFRLWVEYIQTVSSTLTGTTGYSSGQDYQLNAEPSISVMLSQVFSLKSAYLFKYVNYLPTTSTTTKYLNTAFTTSLVAKF